MPAARVDTAALRDRWKGVHDVERLCDRLELVERVLGLLAETTSDARNRRWLRRVLAGGDG